MGNNRQYNFLRVFTLLNDFVAGQHLKWSHFSRRSSQEVFPLRFERTTKSIYFFLQIITICTTIDCSEIGKLKSFLIVWNSRLMFFAQIGNKTECALLGFVMDLGVDYQKVCTIFSLRLQQGYDLHWRESPESSIPSLPTYIAFGAISVSDGVFTFDVITKKTCDHPRRHHQQDQTWANYFLSLSQRNTTFFVCRS